MVSSVLRTPTIFSNGDWTILASKEKSDDTQGEDKKYKGSFPYYTTSDPA